MALPRRSTSAADFIIEAQTIFSEQSKANKNNDESYFGSNKDGGFVYLVSKAWFEDWKDKTGFDYLQDGTSLTEQNVKLNKVLPVLNEDIVDHIKTESIQKIGELVPSLSYLDVVVKMGCIEGTHFIYVDDALWKYIKQQYPDSITVKRKAYTNSRDELCYEIHCPIASFNYYHSNLIEDIKKNHAEHPPRLLFQVSSLMSKAELFDLAIGTLKRSERYLPGIKKYLPNSVNLASIQLFLIRNGEDGVQTLNKALRSLPADDKNYTLNGVRIGKESNSIRSTLKSCEIDLGQDPAFAVEFKRYSDFCLGVKGDNGSDKSDDDSHGYNKQPAIGPRSNFLTRSDRHAEETKKPASRLGNCGLKNLGNTCYMNSALQCLSNTKGLTDYFLKKEYVQDKNPDNVLGSKCKLVEAYYGLNNKMWYGDDERVSPSDFKYEMGNFQSAFEGMSQHDSQELLSRLLDGLHEDLNLINKKPYIEDKDYNNLEDGPHVARTFWINFLRRNYSKIITLFYGQFRSQIECPKCKHVSVKYDSYELLSLPVPRVETITMNGFDISKNHDKQARKVNFKVRMDDRHIPTYTDLLREYCKARGDGLDPKHFMLCFSGFSVHGDIIPPNKSCQDIYKKSKDQSYRPRLFMIEKTPEEVAISQNPNCINVFCLVKLKEDEDNKYSDPLNPSFTKVVFALPNTTVRDFYFLVFLKFAHYVNVTKLTDQKGVAMETEDQYPRPVDDYKELFSQLVGNSKLKYGFIFRIKVGNEILDMESTDKLGEVIQRHYQGKESKDWDEKLKVLKIEIWLDPNSQRNHYIGLDWMKKITNEEVDVNVSSMPSDDGDQKLDITNLLNFFSEPEVLDDDNLYKCAKCKESVNGLRQIQIYKAPKYLILHMKKLKGGFDRFRSGGGNNLMVNFPVEGLDMTNFVLDKEPIESYNVRVEEFMDAGNAKLSNKIIPEFNWPPGKRLIYNCYGVINHYGSMHFGHYTAFAKNNDQWYCFDDSTVTKIDDPNSIVTEAAYVLFYERVDS